MIVKMFNNAADLPWPVKEFETSLLAPMIKRLNNDDKHTLFVNNMWYTDEYHQTVLDYLDQNYVDRIILVSLVDSAIEISHSEKFSSIDKEIIKVGTYKNENDLDFWALWMGSKNFSVPSDVELLQIESIDTAYMCLNRKPHWHRLQLYKELETLNLLDLGLVSLGSITGVAIRSLVAEENFPPLPPNPSNGQFGLPNDIISLGNIPNWQRCFLNVVTETLFDLNHYEFVSEKIFKPILGLRPFLVYDADGAYNWMTSRGFLPYVDDFKDISDLDLKNPKNLAPFLSMLCAQPKRYWQKKLIDLNEKIMYNRDQFYRYVEIQRDKVNKGIICQI